MWSCWATTNFYPRPPRGGRQCVKYSPTKHPFISIHVPREGDDTGMDESPACKAISIHVPREGDDMDNNAFLRLNIAFLSTSPARGTTRHIVAVCPLFRFLSTSPARGTTQDHHQAETAEGFLSTSPARGTTRQAFQPQTCAFDFYPRPPRGGRQFFISPRTPLAQISIHVPREGDDPTLDAAFVFPALFLSTSPARGTTTSRPRPCGRGRYFYPRPPRGGRRNAVWQLLLSRNFYPRPPRGGRHGQAPCR